MTRKDEAGVDIQTRTKTVTLSASRSYPDRSNINHGEAGGKEWTGQRRRYYYVAPAQLKHRWIKKRAGEQP